MSRFKTGMAVVIAASLLASVAVFAERSAVPEAEIGLSRATSTEVPTPDPTLINMTDPGEIPVTGPMFAGGPPMIPHGMVDFLPITADRNDCVECHAVQEKLEGEASPIPPSHYIDLRNRPGEIAQEIAGARYVCVACHVSLGGNELLVGNDFEGD